MLGEKLVPLKSMHIAIVHFSLFLHQHVKSIPWWRLESNSTMHVSGGGWGGQEKIVIMDDVSSLIISYNFNRRTCGLTSYHV